MKTLFDGVLIIAFFSGAYFFIKLILATIRGQPKGAFLKKLGVAVIVLVIAGIGSDATRTPAQRAAHEAADKEIAMKLAAEEKKVENKTAEEKAVDENKIQAAQENPQPVERPKSKEDEEFEKNYARLDEEHKNFYEETYQSLLRKEGLFSDHAYTEKEAREEAMTRALNKQKDADKAATKAAKEQADNLAKAKEDLTKFENEHNVSYQDFGDGTFNIAITFKHGSISTFGIEDKNEYYDPDDKERMYMARECTKIVQMFNDAGVNVNHFTITMTGNVINSNGDKWEDTIGICEFDNQKFPRNDFRSFYNKCSRFWVMESK